MTFFKASPEHKIIILGTALWGWGVDRVTAYRMLEHFLKLGGRIVDTATNYPINKQPEDFGLAVSWISDWIALNGKTELSVLVKMGATDNMGGTSSNLSSINILNSMDFFRERFGESLAAIAIHWDNRGDNNNDHELIAETVNVMNALYDSGLQVGLSGIKHPELYLELAPYLSNKWWIQVKENMISNTARLEYEKYFLNARYLAYGINMSGIKSEPPSSVSSLTLRGVKHRYDVAQCLTEFVKANYITRPMLKNLNELALLHSFLNQSLSGVIIGPRNVEQLQSTIHFWNKLNELDVDAQATAFRQLQLANRSAHFNSNG